MIREALSNKAQEYVLENVDRINFVSESSRNRFLELHPSVPSETIHVCQNNDSPPDP